jgi:hypothetical protein
MDHFLFPLWLTCVDGALKATVSMIHGRVQVGTDSDALFMRSRHCEDGQLPSDLYESPYIKVDLDWNGVLIRSADQYRGVWFLDMQISDPCMISCGASKRVLLYHADKAQTTHQLPAEMCRHVLALCSDWSGPRLGNTPHLIRPPTGLARSRSHCRRHKIFSTTPNDHPPFGGQGESVIPTASCRALWEKQRRQTVWLPQARMVRAV